MAWIKDAILDVIILLFIAIYVVWGNSILEVILWVYTGLLMLSKVLAFFMPSLQQRANRSEVPSFFYNIVYAITVGLFIYGQDYYLGGVWGIIWIISVIQYASSKTKRPTKK